MEKAMTVQTETGKAVYIGDGKTTTFPVPFYFFGNQISVYYNQSTDPMQEGLDYTIHGSGQINGGEIILNRALEFGETITITRNVELTQLITFLEGEKFPAADFEYSLDKIVMSLQQLKELLDSCVSLPNAADITKEQAYQLLVYLNNNVENIEKISQLLTDLAETKHYLFEQIYNKAETDAQIAAAVAHKYSNVLAHIATISADNNYEEYPYRWDIPIANSTEENVAIVTLSLVDALSGNFAPITKCQKGFISLYMKQQASENMIIPCIILH